MNEFQRESRERLETVREDHRLTASAREFVEASIAAKYSYNFTWQGRPIIQYPQDIVAMQEIVWATRPDLIIETGIAHGGSLILSASLLALLDLDDATREGRLLDPANPRRRVLGVDIDIREHNKQAILAHPLNCRIDMLQGSSVAAEIVAQVAAVAASHGRVMVCLDSNHTHEHVLAELEAYAPLVTPGCYCVVFDSVVEDLPSPQFQDRSWGPGDNPKTALREYSRRLAEEGRKAADGKPLHFVNDQLLENKLLITVAPEGYLRRE